MIDEWNGKDHPTDYASRVLSAVKLMQKKRWVHAPELLW